MEEHENEVEHPRPQEDYGVPIHIEHAEEPPRGVHLQPHWGRVTR